MKVNSHIIKLCLMKHYRFTRGFICADEAGWSNADVLVDTGSKIIEIEVKISKYDLWKGEARKRKHQYIDDKRGCNQFILCVPTELLEEGQKWIAETNEKYGLIEFNTELLKDGYQYWKKYLTFVKRAKMLNKRYNDRLHHQLCMRVCSALINEYERRIK